MMDAVTFDFWNTLVYEEPGQLRGLRVNAWLEILDRAGIAVPRERLDELFEMSWQAYLDRWRRNSQYRGEQAARDVIGDLGMDIPSDVASEMVDAFGAVGMNAELHLTDGIESCLRSLKSAGVKIGIVCDVGMTASPILLAHLERHGLLAYFDHWSFSDKVGAYKPSRVIFEHALDGLGGVDPGRAAHVGDLRRTDIAGAIGMGMTSVRYTGIFDDSSQPEPEADHVVADHRRLPELIGI